MTDCDHPKWWTDTGPSSLSQRNPGQLCTIEYSRLTFCPAFWPCVLSSGGVTRSTSSLEYEVWDPMHVRLPPSCGYVKCYSRIKLQHCSRIRRLGFQIVLDSGYTANEIDVQGPLALLVHAQQDTDHRRGQVLTESGGSTSSSSNVFETKRFLYLYIFFFFHQSARSTEYRVRIIRAECITTGEDYGLRRTGLLTHSLPQSRKNRWFHDGSGNKTNSNHTCSVFPSLFSLSEVKPESDDDDTDFFVSEPFKI